MEDRPPYDAWGSPPLEPPPPPPSPSPVIPWEDRSRPWPGAFVETIGALLTSPRRAFESVPVRGDVLRPLLFAILVNWIGTFANVMWELTVGESLRAMMPGWGGGSEIPRVYWFAGVAFSPLSTAIGLVLAAAIMHLFLLLYGGARNGFVATFRTLCYTHVGALAMIIPFCGGLLLMVIVIGLTILGLSVLHRISLGRSAAAVLTPLFLFCVCVSLALFLGGAAALSTLGGLNP